MLRRAILIRRGGLPVGYQRTFGRAPISSTLRIPRGPKCNSNPLSAAFTTSCLRLAIDSVKVPQMAESISEGTISQLLKQVGDWIEADEEVATIETDKIDVTVNSTVAGTITKLLVNEGDTVTVGQDVFELDTEGVVAGAGAGPGGVVSARINGKLDQAPDAEEKQIDESQSRELSDQQTTSTPPTSPQPEAQRPIPTSVPAQSQNLESSSTRSPSRSREDRVEKLSRMRKTIATRLKQSQNICASLTTVQRIDVSALKDWRSKNKEQVQDNHGVRLGYMGAFVKAAALAAKRVPQINASIDTDKEIITYRDYVDISIAVSTPKGLVTPVIHDCDKLSIIDIERGVAALAKKARDGKLTLADLEGGNFSISNPGIFGSMFGTPLINYPQAAVFNINSIKDDVVAVNGEVKIRPMMYITLTYDHRLIDGREAVTFLNVVKEKIEDPTKLLFD